MRIAKRPRDFNDIKTRKDAVLQAAFNKEVLCGASYMFLLLSVNRFAAVAVSVRQTKLYFDEMIDWFCLAVNCLVLDCDYVDFTMLVAVVILDKFKTTVF